MNILNKTILLLFIICFCFNENAHSKDNRQITNKQKCLLLKSLSEHRNSLFKSKKDLLLLSKKRMVDESISSIGVIRDNNNKSDRVNKRKAVSDKKRILYQAYQAKRHKHNKRHGLIKGRGKTYFCK